MRRVHLIAASVVTSGTTDDHRGGESVRHAWVSRRREGRAVTGVYLFVALTWLETLKELVLYTAALAFRLWHPLVRLGLEPLSGQDGRPTGLMSIAFTIISVLGIVVFFPAGAWPVGALFAGLTSVYISEFFASFQIGARTVPPSSADSAVAPWVASGSLGASRAPAETLSSPVEGALGFFEHHHRSLV
jgi:hypothetical protein